LLSLQNAGGNANYSMGSLQHMTNMLSTPTASHAPGAGSFGSHLGAPGAPTSSGLSASAPSLQTLSGAMAMAMNNDAQSYKPSYASAPLGAQPAVPSLSDAMSMSFSAPKPATVSPRLSLAGSAMPVGDLGGSAFGLSLGGSKNSLGLFGNPVSDPLAGLGGFSSDLSGGVRGLFQTQEALVDGALELSAGAKPFVPRFGSAGSNASTASPATSSLSGPSLGAFGVGSSLTSGLSGLGLGAPGLGGSSWGSSSGISMDNKADGTKMPGFLSNLLPSELNLDEDNFEYGDPSAIIPDLDSFLLNDN
jgi:hypothetical protein